MNFDRRLPDTRRLPLALPFVAALALATLPARDARADADPALGYVFVSYLVPYGATWAGELQNGEFKTAAPVVGQKVGRGWMGMENLSLGAGIGYDGMNAQLDIRTIPAGITSVDPTTQVFSGALTFGWRLNFQFGNLELWTRFGVGPLVAVSGAGLNPVGGIATNVEAGLDYFIIKEMLAIGVKAWASPSYRFPLYLTADIDFALGLRLCI